MSVLSQAVSTINTIANGFKNRAGVAARARNDEAGVIARIQGAETMAKTTIGVMAKMENDSKEATSALQAVLANTQTADRHKAVPASAKAAGDSKKAVDALSGLETEFQNLAAKVRTAYTAVDEAKKAQAAAQTVVAKTASSL